MTEPLVCAIMLTKDRPARAQRAVECFRSQTYQNKRLLIVNSNLISVVREDTLDTLIQEPPFEGLNALTIGELRNLGNKYASHHYAESWTRPEIFIHWDDDDWSHPNRIAEQVALLQASGKQVVGYRDMLFWRVTWFKQQLADVTMGGMAGGDPDPYRKFVPGYREETGDAWLYSNADPRYCLGTSLCYWRETWEKRPFKALPTPGSTGEDHEFLRDRDTLGVSSMAWDKYASQRQQPADEPRMICSIHGGNTSGQYANLEQSSSWKRAPEWDAHCRKVIAL